MGPLLQSIIKLCCKSFSTNSIIPSSWQLRNKEHASRYSMAKVVGQVMHLMIPACLALQLL